MRTFCLTLTVLTLAGCESGLARSIKLTVPAEVAEGFSPGSPGIVLADLGGSARPYLVLCGQQVKNPVRLSQDLGFGCLDELDGTTETVRAWVQPMPAGWDAAATCAAQKERSFYTGLSLGPADAGEPLAEQPEASWPQASQLAKWRRDGSPCGGVLDAELALKAP